MASKKFLVDLDLAQNQILNGVFQVLASAPGAPVEGQIYYNSTSKKFWGWDGTAWLDLSNTGSGNTNLTFSRDGTTVTVESSTGSDATLPAATTSLAGVMSAADKTKLDGIQAGAQANVATNIAQGTRTATTVPVTSSTGSGATLDAATSSVAGVMSAADKSKLDGIAAGANKIDNATQVPFNNTNTGFAATNVQAAIDESKTYVDNRVSGASILKGGYNASTNTPNLTSGTGVKTGYTYVITSAGTFHGEAVQVGDMILANQDTPTALAHWILVNKNIPDIVDASTTAKGLVEEATEAEAKNPSAETGGTGAKLFVTPKQLHAAVNDKADLVRTYNTTVGNGSATDFTVTHNLNKLAVVVRTYQVSDGKEVETFVEATGVNTVKVYFNTAPTSNQYRVVVHA